MANRKSQIANQRGVMLIETIIALSIAVVGLMALMSLISRSLSLNRVVADRYIAANLAIEGVEIVKNIADNNTKAGLPWNYGLSTGDFEADYRDDRLESYRDRVLLFDDKTGLYSYDSGDQSRFVRKIIVRLIGSEEIQVNTIVDWTTRGGGEFSLNVEDHFFNWR